jgi:heat shock 70kDa protein 1/2/6/8
MIPRRLIGRRFDDQTVKKDVESWPFKVIDQEGNPFVQVEYLGETKVFSPQEISSMVLMKVSAPSLVTPDMSETCAQYLCR